MMSDLLRSQDPIFKNYPSMGSFLKRPLSKSEIRKFLKCFLIKKYSGGAILLATEAVLATEVFVGVGVRICGEYLSIETRPLSQR